MSVWQVQEAKSKFSELIRVANSTGPQFVTSHGRKVAVVLSVEAYDQLTAPKKSLVQFLLDSPLRESDLTIERDPSDTIREVGL